MSIQARPLSFADQVCQNNKKTTKLKNFLDVMEKVVPWSEFIARIEPHYHRSGGRGRQPYPLQTMLRIYLVQIWQNYSDPNCIAPHDYELAGRLPLQRAREVLTELKRQMAGEGESHG